MADNIRIIFDHLQKTGGTALSDFLADRLGKSRVSPLILHESIRYASRLLETFDVVGGHLDLEPAYEWDADVYHLTVLRDPVERFLSHYSYVRAQPDASEPFARLARRHDVAALLRLDDAAVLPTVQDFYTRHFLAALMGPDARRDALADSRLQAGDVFDAIAARYNLIGVSERMDAVARVLCHLLRLPAGPVLPVRVTHERLRARDLDPQTLALLRDLTARDRALYDRAAARFDIVAHALGPANDARPAPPALAGYAKSRLPGPFASAELFCPASEINDSAISGEECVLAVRLETGTLAGDVPIELRINDPTHRLVYRDTYRLRSGDERAPGPVELLWRFVCVLGRGTYSCSFQLGEDAFEEIYQFGVVQPAGSQWVGIADLRPRLEVQRLLPEDLSLEGEIVLPEAELEGEPGSLLETSATVRNNGAADWHPHGRNRFVASYKIRSEAGTYVIDEGLRTALPGRVAPGQARDVMLRIRAPEAAGRYVVEPHLVCEHVGWFGKSPDVALQVSPR